MNKRLGKGPGMLISCLSCMPVRYKCSHAYAGYNYYIKLVELKNSYSMAPDMENQVDEQGMCE